MLTSSGLFFTHLIQHDEFYTWPSRDVFRKFYLHLSICFFLWHLPRPRFFQKEFLCKGIRECITNLAGSLRSKSSLQSKRVQSHSVTSSMFIFSAFGKDTALHNRIVIHFCEIQIFITFTVPIAEL